MKGLLSLLQCAVTAEKVGCCLAGEGTRRLERSEGSLVMPELQGGQGESLGQRVTAAPVDTAVLWHRDPSPLLSLFRNPQTLCVQEYYLVSCAVRSSAQPLHKMLKMFNL